jgi:His-Xaa-Ser system protein HxsD
MAPHPDGFFDGAFGVDLDEGSAHLDVDEALYPIEALHGAAYTFLDRCYVHLDRPGPGRLRATLAPRAGDADGEALRALVGEFANELLSCAYRRWLTIQNQAAIEAATRLAISRAMGPSEDPRPEAREEEGPARKDGGADSER